MKATLKKAQKYQVKDNATLTQNRKQRQKNDNAQQQQQQKKKTESVRQHQYYRMWMN